MVRNAVFTWNTLAYKDKETLCKNTHSQGINPEKLGNDFAAPTSDSPVKMIKK